MSELFGGILKPGEGAQVALRRELKRRRERWDRPGYMYRGGGDLILRHGQFFSGRALPPQYEAVKNLAGPDTWCFLNTLLAVEADPSLRYCEGVYSIGNGGFIGHAWAVDPSGAVVELTLPTHNLERYHDARRMNFLPVEHWAYAGVVVRHELVQWHLDNGFDLPMLDRPVSDLEAEGRGLDMSQNHDFPILKVPYDPNRTTL